MPEAQAINIDVLLKNAKFYDVRRKFDILKGEKFSLFTDSKAPVIFASTNDAVLSTVEKETSLTGTADSVGTSELIIFNQGYEIQRQITVNVVESLDQADSLNATTGSPVPKVE